MKEMVQELKFQIHINSKTIVELNVSNKENSGLINYGIVYSVKGYEE